MNRAGSSRTTLPLLLVLVGFGLRLARPEVHSFWIDEGMTLIQARSNDLLHTLRDDSHPPLAFLLVRAWGELFGWSDLALRLLPALASCLSLVLFARLARAWFGDERALWALALYACAPLPIWIGHEVRLYAFVELAVLLVLHAARRAWDSPTLARRLLLALAVALATGLHYYGSLAGLAVIAQACLRRARGSLTTREVAATIAAAAAGVAVWIPLFVTLVPAQHANDWPRIALFGWRDLAEIPARLVGVDFVALGDHQLAWIGWVLGALCSLGFGIAVLRCASGRGGSETEPLVAVLVPIAAALALAAFAGGGFQARYLVVAMPGCIACMAAGLLSVRPIALARATIGVLLACALAMSVLQLSENRREDYRGACQEIAERWQAGDHLLVICCVPRPLRMACVDHYLRDRPEILAAAIDMDDYLGGKIRPPSGTRLHVLWREATLCWEPFAALQATHTFDELPPARFRIRRALTRVP